MDKIMDRRMDAGMLLPDEQELPTVEMALSSTDLEWEQFSTHELIEISDTLLAAVITWLRGHSAIDTVLTCVYMHDWKRLKHVYLRTYVASIGVLCYQIHQQIMEAKLTFEEDYNLYIQYPGFEAFQNLDLQAMFDLLEQSAYWLTTDDKALHLRYEFIKVNS
jgi:hypothetical protein